MSALHTALLNKYLYQTREPIRQMCLFMLSLVTVFKMLHTTQMHIWRYMRVPWMRSLSGWRKILQLFINLTRWLYTVHALRLFPYFLLQD